MKRARRPPGASAECEPRETVGLRRRRERRQRAVDFLAGRPLLVGLDLGKTRHAAWLGGPDLTPCGRLMLPHSPDGLAKLLTVVETKRADLGLDRALFFMESTSYFWENVANVLEAKGQAYRLVSPLSVDRQREIEYQTYAKSDHRDAELIAKLGHQGQWLDRMLVRDRLWLELRALAREHDILLEAETAERLRIRSLLGLALPEFLEAFKDPLKKTALAVLRALSRRTDELPTSYAAVRERLGTVVGAYLASAKIRALLARLETCVFGVESALPSTLIRVGLLLDRFDCLAGQREDVRRRLVERYQATPYRPFLDTIPGVGPESHALLLGIIGDPKRYDRATCLVKLAGTEPRDNQSGEGEGSHSISRRGQSALRFLLYRIVSGLSLSNDEFKAYLDRLRKRDENPMAWHQAVVAAGNKYLRVVHHLCVHEEAYRADALRA